MHICLLRGVNVGGRQVKMADLRALFADELGFRDVSTFIQSGNVLFRADEEVDASRMESAIRRRFGFHSDVILRTAEEWRGVVDRNPFAGRPELEGGRLLVTFLSRVPPADALDGFDTAGEELHLVGRELYAYFTNGVGRSKLKFSALAKALGEAGTGRNWNSVLKIAELLQR